MSHKTETLTQHSSNEMRLISLLHSKPFVAFEILIGVLWGKKFPLNFYEYRAEKKKDLKLTVPLENNTAVFAAK